jgi:flagellar biogenesis protein FliO
VIFILPVLLIIGIPIWLVIRFVRKRRRNKKSEQSAVNSQQSAEDQAVN